MLKKSVDLFNRPKYERRHISYTLEALGFEESSNAEEFHGNIQRLFGETKASLDFHEHETPEAYATRIKMIAPGGGTLLSKAEMIHEYKTLLFHILYFLLERKALEQFKALVEEHSIALSA